MASVLNSIMVILRTPSVWRIVSDLLPFTTPLWLLVLIGLCFRWARTPNWAVGFFNRSRGTSENEVSDSRQTVVPGWRVLPSFEFSKEKGEKTSELSLTKDENNKKLVVTRVDLLRLYRLTVETDGGPAWQHMFDKTLPTMSYQAWMRDLSNGLTQYRSRTVFEDATPEQVRDFFWDDEFRISNRWNEMLMYQKTLEECHLTGTMIVHWIRKFPFFCSDREYIIGRRIWDLKRTYFCVTKAVPYSNIPRHNTPRRVDVYFSSWRIRAVESRRSDGHKTSCEVILFHHEDVGIPKEIAKLGIRRGLWNCVKRIEPGIRAYQLAGLPSHLNPISGINTKITQEYIESLDNAGCLEELGELERAGKESESKGGEKPGRVQFPGMLLIGGVVVLACSIHPGLLTKVILFGVTGFLWPKKRV
ncbi:Polyketide cyclase/dehydrase and lipid transport superfamily protein [Rhynchospora pubera]|uniref:Polyketide cyclase/dehydrase and lipid transport superfamily protein n=1 Tax=Rhynchospora pubera TaxID=906938 RepID=A0AAV8DWM9_9POAL|nr:Polyketide cyclase/dehydrase and lipid transport superfamily protein [Rhynchospora pubera]KAJ4788325.1 Polyketide cyclase/dehydrase and lipid transport superfamily protein [Rhynchospora pubera]